MNLTTAVGLTTETQRHRDYRRKELSKRFAQFGNGLALPRREMSRSVWRVLELAPAFGRSMADESASKLAALPLRSSTTEGGRFWRLRLAVTRGVAPRKPTQYFFN